MNTNEFIQNWLLSVLNTQYFGVKNKTWLTSTRATTIFIQRELNWINRSARSKIISHFIFCCSPWKSTNINLAFLGSISRSNTLITSINFWVICFALLRSALIFITSIYWWNTFFGRIVGVTVTVTVITATATATATATGIWYISTLFFFFGILLGNLIFTCVTVIRVTVIRVTVIRIAAVTRWIFLLFNLCFYLFYCLTLFLGWGLFFWRWTTAARTRTAWATAAIRRTTTGAVVRIWLFCSSSSCCCFSCFLCSFFC